MKVKVTVSYPWNVIDDECYIYFSDEISEEEKRGILFDYAIDMMFDRGISWDYKEVEEE